MPELIPVVRRLGSLGLARCQRDLSSLGTNLPLMEAGPSSGQKSNLENLWRDFFSNPSKWWDHRFEKENARYPDFKHKATQKALWLNNKSNPSWVETEVAAMASTAVQLNIFSWNTKLGRHVKVRQYGKALRLFQQMHREGLNPDSFTFVPLLNACAGLQALEEGRRIHTLAIELGFASNVFVCNSLVDMYAKCWSIDDAWRVFQKMPMRNVVSWNTMIQGYVKCGQERKALDLFLRMQENQVTPVRVTFLALLNACASMLSLEEGRCIHAQVIRSGFESDVFVCNSLINMYAKCRSIDDAWAVFNKMPVHDVVAWNAIIRAFVKVGQGNKALELSRQMELEGVEPDPITFVGSLNACTSVMALDEGKRVHERIVQNGCESDVLIGNSLVDMYVKCGSLEEAWKVFNKLPIRNVVTWNSMILGHAKSGKGLKVLELCQWMEHEGVEANSVTFVGLLNACASLKALKQGREIHAQIIKRDWESDAFVGSSLVDMYAKCGCIEDAQAVFNKIPMASRNAVTWNALILGLVKCGQVQKALELGLQMQQEGVQPDYVSFVGLLGACASIRALGEGRRVHKQIVRSCLESNVFVGCSLIDMYVKCGSLEDAWMVFKKMPISSSFAWSAMIQGYVKCSQGQKALELFKEMQLEGVQPDSFTLVGIVNACASVGALQEGRSVHGQIIKIGCECDIFVCNSLINMYAKCGSVGRASKVFNQMPIRDMVSWSSMLGGYAMHGHGGEALGLFERMNQEGVEIDNITFVSLLSACSHAGFVDEGVHYLESMSSAYQISPTMEHCACIIDLLGRAGRMLEGEDLIKRMSYERDVISWKSLLGACQVHGNLEMGHRLANLVVQLDPECSSAYVLLSNIHAAAGN